MLQQLQHGLRQLVGLASIVLLEIFLKIFVGLAAMGMRGVYFSCGEGLQMTKPIDKRGEGQRNLRELFQDYADKYVCEEWDTGDPVGLEKAPDDIVSDCMERICLSAERTE